MNTHTIDRVLRKFQVRNYLGVFARDKIPRDKIGIFVVNLDASDQPGSHWVCVFTDGKKGEFFDSFGRPPPYQSIRNYMDRNCTDGWTYSNKQLQSAISRSCGHYCVLYCILRSKNYNLHRFLALFSTDTCLNDRVVFRLLKR